MIPTLSRRLDHRIRLRWRRQLPELKRHSKPRSHSVKPHLDARLTTSDTQPSYSFREIGAFVSRSLTV